MGQYHSFSTLVEFFFSLKLFHIYAEEINMNDLKNIADFIWTLVHVIDELNKFVTCRKSMQYHQCWSICWSIYWFHIFIEALLLECYGTENFGHASKADVIHLVIFVVILDCIRSIPSTFLRFLCRQNRYIYIHDALFSPVWAHYSLPMQLSWATVIHPRSFAQTLHIPRGMSANRLLVQDRCHSKIRFE